MANVSVKVSYRRTTKGPYTFPKNLWTLVR